MGHAAQHETLAVQVKQLEGSLLASRNDYDIACRMLTDLQGELSELSLLSERVLVPPRTHADESNGTTTEGLQGVGAKVADLQASLASVNNDVSTLGQDLADIRSEHLIAAHQGLAAYVPKHVWLKSLISGAMSL